MVTTRPGDRLEQELHALVPSLISSGVENGDPPPVIAEEVVRIVMTCVRPLIDPPPGTHTSQDEHDGSP